MAVTGHVFGYGINAAFAPNANFHGWVSNSHIANALINSTYTAGDQWTTQYLSTDTGNEISGGGYSRQNLTSSGLAATPSATNTAVDMISSASTNGLTGGVQWTSLTATNVEYDILSDVTSASDSTSPVICFFNLGAAYNLSSGTLALTFGSDGSVSYVVFKVSAS